MMANPWTRFWVGFVACLVLGVICGAFFDNLSRGVSFGAISGVALGTQLAVSFRIRNARDGKESSRLKD